MAQALEPEEITVTDVKLSSAREGQMDLTVELLYQGRELSAALTILS